MKIATATVHHAGKDVLGRPCRPDRQSGGCERRQHEKPDSPAEIAAVNSDQELYQPGGARAEGRSGAFPPAEEAAIGEQSRREQDEPGDRPLKKAGWRDQKEGGADGPARQANQHERPEADPGGAAMSRRPTQPVVTWPGKSAKVDAMFAVRASRPLRIRVGKVTKEPPPANAFWTPAHSAARNKSGSNEGPPVFPLGMWLLKSGGVNSRRRARSTRQRWRRPYERRRWRISRAVWRAALTEAGRSSRPATPLSRARAPTSSAPWRRIASRGLLDSPEQAPGLLVGGVLALAELRRDAFHRGIEQPDDAHKPVRQAAGRNFARRLAGARLEDLRRSDECSGSRRRRRNRSPRAAGSVIAFKCRSATSRASTSRTRDRGSPAWRRPSDASRVPIEVE